MAKQGGFRRKLRNCFDDERRCRGVLSSRAERVTLGAPSMLRRARC